MSLDEYYASEREIARRAPAVNAANKAALFAVLTTPTTVTISGGGDEGGIDNITPAPPEGPLIDFIDLGYNWQTKQVDEVVRQLTPEEAIESITYDLLSQHHGGWENNDGGDGECLFDPETQIITLTMNIHYTDSNQYIHEL